MEAYGSVLIDQAVHTRRNSSSVPVFSNSCIQNGVPDGFLSRSASQQLLSCYGALFPGTRPPMYASIPLPPPTYGSLPHPHLLQQSCAPLLPLPLSRSLSVPSPSPPVSARRAAGPGVAVRAANKDQKKPRPSSVKGSQPAGRPHKEPPAASAPGRVPKSAVSTTAIKDGAAKDGGYFTDDVYALSPPPSSLPMPRFSLRARGVPSSSPSFPCDAEGCKVDAGATDDLRQLLRF